MAGAFRHSQDIPSMEACAAHHRVTVQSVRLWKKKGDPRWAEWKNGASDKPVGRPPEPKQPRSPMPAIEDDQLGEGIEAEIFAARAECKRLRHLAAQLEQGGDFSDAALVHRILDSKRDQLRKLSADNPDILARAGDLVPKAVLFAYVTRVKLMVESLARRLMAVVPEDMRSTLRPAMEKECAALCAAAQEIDLNK